VVIMLRQVARVGLILVALLFGLQAAWAEVIHLMESHPAASAVMNGRSDGFFVRFDKPVDHEHALITITRGGKVIETLHPRLDSSPDVLFARAPKLPQGDYALHWSVKQMVGTELTEGDVPFMVKP
jgi:methionine-rich copper-binding protein CopC